MSRNCEDCVNYDGNGYCTWHKKWVEKNDDCSKYESK